MIIWDLFRRGIEAGVEIGDRLASDTERGIGMRSTDPDCRPKAATTRHRQVCPDYHCIPEPCWMPLPLGEVTSFACPGSSVTLRVRVTNRGMVTRTISLEAVSKHATVSIQPPQLTLGPMERGMSAFTATLPADASRGQHFEILVWVRGCRQHYLRWTIRAENEYSGCCYETEVDDGPDFVHHWYDHFYCQHPCAK